MEKDIFNKINYENLKKQEKIKLAKVINDELFRIYEGINKRKVHVNHEFLKKLIESEFFILLNVYYPKCIRLIDFAGFSFDGINVAGKDFSYTNANIDPQKVYSKNLHYTNLKGIDLSDKKFDGVFIEGANLEETHADIDPQLIFEKSLFDTKLKGLYLSKKSFDNVDIRYSDLRDTNAKIIISNLKKNKNEHPLHKTKLTGCKVYKGNTDTLLDNLYIVSCYLKGNIVSHKKEQMNELKKELRNNIIR